jgi:Na+/melibiose symporter-like transporter
MYRIAMIFYIFFLCVLPFISGNSILIIYIISGVVGFCHAAAITLPWAIIPDIVEYDEYHNGSRREGLFYGGTTFSYKAATGIAFLLGSLILQLSGYVPNAVQSDSASFSIRFLVGPLPACFIAVAVIISLKYPLNKFRYEEILKELEKRRSMNSY